MTTADYDALEARVTELEHQTRNILPPMINAVSYGVSVMHGEMTEQFGEMRERLGKIEIGQSRQADQLARQDQRLGKIETTQDRQDQRLGKIETSQDRQDQRLGKIETSQQHQTDQLTRQGEQLAEILRRLPGGPAEQTAG